MITLNEILMGRDREFPLDSTLEKNLQLLHHSLNKFRKIYNKPLTVSSGYRPVQYNQNAGGAKKSNHMSCLACDFLDKDGALDMFCISNLDALKECGLYLEHPKWTLGWCHLQVIAPSSKSRVFIPSKQQPATDKHDKLFDSYELH